MSSSAVASSPRNRILIIDDDHRVLQAIHGFLSRHFDVSLAVSGEEGIELATKLMPDLILLDIVMPSSNGISVCRKLKASERTRKIPVIMLTASDDDDLRAQALLSGADDLASKPFRPREFLVRIETKIRQSKNAASNEGTVECGNLTIDLRSLRVTINGECLPFSMLEINLLKHFIKNLDSILTREQVLDAVWQNRFVNERVVDNHVMQLRKKLSEFDHELVSFYGAGYGLRKRS